MADDPALLDRVLLARQMWLSVPQIAVSDTFTIASFGPQEGIGFSSRTIRSWPSNTAAFIVSVISRLPPSGAC